MTTRRDRDVEQARDAIEARKQEMRDRECKCRALNFPGFCPGVSRCPLAQDMREEEAE